MPGKVNDCAVNRLYFARFAAIKAGCELYAILFRYCNESTCIICHKFSI